MVFFDQILNLFRHRRWEFESAAVSDRGLVRPDNQDSFLNEPRFPAFVVADGMGGGEGGAIASQWVCEAMQKVFVHRVRLSMLDRMELVSAVLAKSNERIRRYAQEHLFQSMGTTVALLFADPRRRSRGVICHAGDSRVYRLRDGRLQALTRDHTVGNELSHVLRNGSETAFGDDSTARSNPLAHVLTRAVGVEDEFAPEWHRVTISPGDAYLLCSDGVFDMVSDEVIREAMTRPPAEAVKWLSIQVRDAGAGDNYTIICIRVKGGT